MKINEIYLVLNSIKGIGPKTIGNISLQQLNQIGDNDDLYNFLKNRFSKKSKIQIPSKDDFKRLINDVERLIKRTQDDGQVIINQYDDLYPKQFKRLNSKPIFFFAKGNISLLKKRGIAVIGTREVSDFGKRIGIRFGEVLAERKKVVISGLAKGCDAAGHKGCLNKDGSTIAILATPLNQIYPAENIGLAEEILAKDGCFISEYGIGSQVQRYNFINRDRLQCGLADGIIVVETGVEGGTWHAIRGAQKLQKPIGCFAYKAAHYDRNPHSLGNRILIQNRIADPLTDSKSIDEFLIKTESNNQVEQELFS